MKQLMNNKKILKIANLKQSGLYDIELLERLEVGDFSKLAQLSVDDRNNRYFMEPLLYAVKNEKNTYKVYKDYGDTLKTDILRDNMELAVEIVINEPELIEGTPISRNPQFILEHVQSNPKMIRHIDQRLLTSNKFVSELNNKNNSEIASEIVRAGIVEEILSNSQLSNDRDYMSNVIRKDATMLEYISETLKNDGEFLRNEAMHNEDIINYVSNNAEKFGLDGIEGVRESSTDYVISNQEYSKIIDEKAQGEYRYKNAQTKIEENINKGNKGTATFITAAVVAQSDNVNEEFVRRTVNYAALTMETIKQDLSESGEMKIDIESRKQRRLITPIVLDRLLQKLEEQGINLDKGLKQKIDSYKEFYSEYTSQVREKIRKEYESKISKSEVQNVTKKAIPDKNIGKEIEEKGIEGKQPEITL